MRLVRERKFLMRVLIAEIAGCILLSAVFMYLLLDTPPALSITALAPLSPPAPADTPLLPSASLLPTLDPASIATHVSRPPTPTPRTSNGLPATIAALEEPLPPTESEPPANLEARVALDGDHLRLRAAPSTAGQILVLLEAFTPLEVVGRTADDFWLEVSIGAAQHGWVMRKYVEVFVDLAGVPVTGAAVDATETPPPFPVPLSPGTQPVGVLPGPTYAPPPNGTGAAANYVSYTSPYPYLSNLTSRMREIYLTGRVLGNRPNVFSKVGDSITVAPDFLTPIGLGQARLHDFGYLAPVIHYFSTDPVWDANSFANHSFAAANGWSAWTALDVNYADQTWCRPGESPLRCEYRLARPALALIMLGTNDAASGSGPDAFRANLSTIVNSSLQMGVIPVLSTLPDRTLGDIPGARVWEFNAVIREVAQTYSVPLWDYWAALQGLPEQGIGDTVHPSTPPNGNAADFSPENLSYGYTVRNLGALFVLDALWQKVIVQG